MANGNSDTPGSNFSVPKPGEILAGKYRIEGVMARGGHGVVYAAHQLGVERPAVIKVLPPSAGHDNAAFKRFEREARVASSLNHPNTVTIFEFGVSDGGLMFIAMERLAGDPLNVAVAREGALDPERTRKIMIQICEALVAAHAEGIIHRDLKPGNVLLCDIHGKKDWVKIIDFGIAKVLEAVDESLVQTLTQDGLTMGTPGYIAPELLAGGKATPACDLYAVGVMGYELMTGHEAFDGNTPFEKIRKQLQEKPTDPPEPIKRSPLWPVVEKLLERNPADRYQTAEEALAVLEGLPKLDQPIAAPAATPRASGIQAIPTDAPTVAIGTTKPTPVGNDAPTQAMPIAPQRPRAASPVDDDEGGGGIGLIVGIAVGIFVLIIVGVGAALMLSGDDAPPSDKPPIESPAPVTPPG